MRAQSRPVANRASRWVYRLDNIVFSLRLEAEPPAFEAGWDMLRPHAVMESQALARADHVAQRYARTERNTLNVSSPELARVCAACQLCGLAAVSQRASCTHHLPFQSYAWGHGAWAANTSTIMHTQYPPNTSPRGGRCMGGGRVKLRVVRVARGPNGRAGARRGGGRAHPTAPSPPDA